MVFGEINGRCGNQMFMYAASRVLENLHGGGLAFNFYHIEQKSINDKTWKDDLELFNVKKYRYESNSKKLVLIYGSRTQKMVYYIYSLVCRIPYRERPNFYKRQERLQPIINHFGIYDMVHGYYPIQKSKYKDQFICGTYEDSRFFNGIRKNLLDEFTAKAQPKTENDQLYNIIHDSESVCVSFRRGDFLSGGNNDLRNICSKTYYEKAIQTMKNIIPNAKFVFFSDDIQWVRDNCNFGVDSYYESGIDGVDEKLRLMSSCKHFIMSNSTFCWWAQYLSKNDDKVVISPDHWFNMPGYKHQLIERDWILINDKV